MIAKRYGKRPSDIYGRADEALPLNHPRNIGKLDEYQAFQFDAGIATRYQLIDNDNDGEKLTAVLNGINSLLRAWGAKGAKHQKYKRTVEVAKEKQQGDIVTGGVTNMTVTEIVRK